MTALQLIILALAENYNIKKLPDDKTMLDCVLEKLENLDFWVYNKCILPTDLKHSKEILLHKMKVAQRDMEYNVFGISLLDPKKTLSNVCVSCYIDAAIFPLWALVGGLKRSQNYRPVEQFVEHWQDGGTISSRLGKLLERRGLFPAGVVKAAWDDDQCGLHPPW